MFAKLKPTIFDGIFFGYSVMALMYLFYRLFLPEISDDQFELHMTALFLISATICVVSAILLRGISKMGIPTLGDALFARTKISQASYFWKIHLLISFLSTLVVSYLVTEVSI